MIEAGVQVGARSQMLYKKFLRMSWPCSVCCTSGWNCTPYSLAVQSSMAATGKLGLTAVTVKPDGSSTTESPWLIQQALSLGSPASSWLLPLSDTVRPPYSATPVFSTRPPLILAMSCRP